METLKYILKGILIGIGKVIPGVSGSLIAYTLGLYEPCIEAISNLFKNLKHNLYFLGKIALGILFAVMLGSKIIDYFLSNYYMITMFTFVGLILGTLYPNSIKLYKKDYLLFVGTTVVTMLILLQTTNLTYTFNGHFLDYIYIFLMGFLDAFTMIVPGISGTALFMILGSYHFLLDIFQNIFGYMITDPLLIFSLGSGVISGVFLTSKLINRLLKKHKHKIEVLILSFSLSSVFYLFIKTFYSSFYLIEFFEGIIFLVIGYVISFICSS